MILSALEQHSRIFQEHSLEMRETCIEILSSLCDLSKILTSLRKNSLKLQVRIRALTGWDWFKNEKEIAYIKLSTGSDAWSAYRRGGLGCDSGEHPKERQLITG